MSTNSESLTPAPAKHSSDAGYAYCHTIDLHLAHCAQLAPDFRELRNISVSNLMYVKEDLIIPNQYTFYDLIINKVLVFMACSGGLHSDLN